jgi:hypothetical protein
MRAWAQSVACGVPDEVYWRSTPTEAGALLDELVDLEARRERNAMLRAGLVAAAVYNVHRKAGSRAFRAEDFVRKEREEAQEVTPAQMRAWLLSWAERQNRRLRRKA